MRSKHLVAILVLLALAMPASPAHAGGIVSVCDEAHLLAALAGGGTVILTCSGTITLTATITVAANTTLDGSGQAVTISGNHLVRVFSVSSKGRNCDGTITDGGGNLSYPDTTCPGINADPLLGPLQNNGGPTQTMDLGPGSAAFEAGDNATCAAALVNNLDQRGVTRPQGARCDIGAVEHLLPFWKWFPATPAQ